MRVLVTLRRWLRWSGSAAIEYALILPVLLLCIFGLMDTARLIWCYATLSRAVDAAARCAAINTTACGTTAQIQSVAVAEAWGLTIASSAFTAATATCGIRVTGTYDFDFVMPGFNYVVPTGTITLTTSSCYPS
jgi:Flp pilus assembly protein TadG